MNTSKADYFSLKSQHYLRTGQQTCWLQHIRQEHGTTCLYLLDLYHELCQLHLYDDNGTYEPILESQQKVVLKLKQLLVTHCNDCEATVTRILARTLTNYADDSLSHGNLCKFYIIWKLHKPANKRGRRGVMSRPTASRIGYSTWQGRGCSQQSPVHFERLTQTNLHHR